MTELTHFVQMPNSGDKKAPNAVCATVSLITFGSLKSKSLLVNNIQSGKVLQLWDSNIHKNPHRKAISTELAWKKWV